MQSMTVYRIQSKQDRTRGVYDVSHILDVRPDIIQSMHDAHGDWENIEHPSPYQSFNRTAKCDEFCGCPSAATLLRWFKGYIPDLLRAGYEIVALCDVTITAVDEYQVLFKWDEVTNG